MDIKYLAGIIDGEGYVGIRRCVTKGDMLIPEFKPTITITNTNYDLMVALKDNFKGSICNRGQKNSKWKKSFAFEFNRSEIRRILPLILPHLILKKKQAELLGELFGTYKEHLGIKHGYSVKEVQEKERLHKRSLLLNKRGF